MAAVAYAVLRAPMQHAGAGDAAQARLHPAGDDVHHLRAYRRGDSRRAIAWKPSARRGALLAELEMMLELEQGGSRQLRHHDQLIQVNPPPRTQDDQAWPVQVLKTIASTDGGVGTGEGIAELVTQLDLHREWLQGSGEWAVRERLRAAHTLENILRAELTRRILAHMPTTGLDELVEAIYQRETDPYRAALHLMRDW